MCCCPCFRCSSLQLLLGKLARSSSSRFLAVLSHYLELHFGHPALLTKGRRQDPSYSRCFESALYGQKKMAVALQEPYNVAGNAVAQSRFLPEVDSADL